MARYVIIALFMLFCLSGCWIDAVDQPGGGDTDSTAVFNDVSAENIPVDTLSANSMDAKAADIDGDGDLDLVIAVEFNPNKILINNGKGVFTDESNQRLPATNFDSQALAVADFNADGSPDLIFVSKNDRVNEYYLNDGNGFFTDASNRLPVAGTSNTVLSADINADGFPDLLIGNDGPNVILINDGSGFFSNQSQERLPQINHITQDINATDIDGDGDLDILAANEDNNRLLLNTAGGFFVDRTQTRLPLTGAVEESRDINAADVNNDGSPDLYFGNVILFQDGSSTQDRLLINNAGNFTDVTQKQLPAINTNTVDADFFDIDRDGDFDIITGDFGAQDENTGNYSGTNFTKVFINDGAGSYSDQTTTYLPKNFSPKVVDFEIADYNGDGLLDIYVANFASPDMLLLQQAQ